jgi:predicted deacylase
MASQDWVVGSLSARPGEKKSGVQELKIAGQTYQLPLFIVNGARPGPTLAVTGGIHGAEFASIAAALELGRQLDPQALTGRVIIAPVVNGHAFSTRSIYINPMDGVNLNRVFPGKADGGASEQIADWVFRHVIAAGNYYVDLHGGDLIEALVPFTLFGISGNEKVDKTTLEMAQAFGIRYLVGREAVGGSTYLAAARAGIPAILTEAGAQGIWPREAVAAHTNGLNRLMRHFGMLPGGNPEAVPTVQLSEFIWLRSDHDGFWYPKPSVDEMVKSGQDLGVVTDFEGHVLQAVKAPAEGRVLFLVSSLAINTGDPLLALGA